ncbi:MAG TPA: ATP-binding protein [Membranihabitans sp.]|nr:ATP-binding protein [Membranihabitans sp.]
MAKLVLSSELENIELIDQFIFNLKKIYHIDSQKFVDIRLSILEAVNNAIIHGNQMDSSKKIVITEEMVENMLLVHIQDQGAGFDWSKVEDPTRKADPSQPGGRGIHLMRLLSDQIDYLNNGQSVLLRFQI